MLIDRDRLLSILHELKPYHATLVAVSKTKPVESIREAYDAGHKVFGENYVAEMADKYDQLPKDIQWHFIGHLQTNKVKIIAPFVSLIHGIDSLKLLKEVDKEAKKINRVIPCLLQVHIAEEETKFGLSLEEAEQLLASTDIRELKNVSINGLMGMATYTDTISQVKKEFHSLKTFYDTVKNKFQLPVLNFQFLSMGMTGDYQIALSEGSNMVRIGSAIFGERGS